MAEGGWNAFPLLNACCNAFLASFKISNVATIGGNLCMSLPAGPMISLTAALDSVCTLWPRRGAPRTVPVVDFVTGNHSNVLRPGELLRSIHVPAASLREPVALRQATLTKLGRSAAADQRAQLPDRCAAPHAFGRTRAREAVAANPARRTDRVAVTARRTPALYPAGRGSAA
ncbi:FAD binding domain-containing protein [Acidocella sp.]|uniref:FAD binding domain-containing protein n=1 Tax=Acidocella sp. TaxID=50710 RepID=UPI0038D098B3